MTSTTGTTYTNTIATPVNTASSVTIGGTAYSGKRWTADEDRRLLQYAANKSHAELARDHKRTELAIRMRLMSKLHNELDSLNYFRDMSLIQSIYDTNGVIDSTSNEIAVIIIAHGSPSYEEIRTYHQMVEHSRKSVSNRRLINDPSTEPKLLDMTLVAGSNIAFLNRYKYTPVIKVTLSTNRK